MADPNPSEAVIEASNAVADDLFSDVLAQAEAATSDPDDDVDLRWILYGLWAHLTAKLVTMGFDDLAEDAADIASGNRAD
jgi:hypothetical protein